MISRRNFFALASGLLVPWEPERVYSFLPAWRLVRRDFFDAYVRRLSAIEQSAEQLPGKMFIGGPRWIVADYESSVLPRSLARRSEEIEARNVGVIHPAHALDLQKSGEAFGYPVVFT